MVSFKSSHHRAPLQSAGSPSPRQARRPGRRASICPKQPSRRKLITVDASRHYCARICSAASFLAADIPGRTRPPHLCRSSLRPAPLCRRGTQAQPWAFLTAHVAVVPPPGLSEQKKKKLKEEVERRKSGTEMK
jgi:hypothetical protein